MKLQLMSRILCLLFASFAHVSQAAAQLSLCNGLVRDKAARPKTFLAKPARGATVADPEFGTTIRRISAVTVSGPDPAIRPMYSTTSAWNADESLMILYHVGAGHRLYDGRTYQFIRYLDIRPADLEQVYWSTTNPNVLHYVDRKTLIRYDVVSGEKQSLRRFSFCQGNVKADSHAFSSWGSGVLGLGCDGKVFAYDIGRNTLSSVEPSPLKPPMAAPSGNLFYYHGYVLDKSLRFVRALDIAEPDTHSSLGRNRLGQDVFNGAMYDPGPRGSGVGSLVSHNMTNGSSRVIIGPSAGFPYPPSATHVSSLAHKRPGWVFVSIVGNTAGRNLLDNEVLLANVDTGEVCRLGHHRSFGKNNTRLATPYWAEPHVSASPTASRALFASDWGNASSVDAYVFELPSYKRPSPGLTLTLGTDRTSYRRGQTMAMTLTLDNVGKGPDIDLYLAAIPPGGSSLFFFDNWSFHRTPANGARPATWPPIAPRVKMPHSFTLDLDSVYRKTWGAGDRTGTHQFLLFATRTGTLRDDRINGNDMVAVGTVLVQLTP